MSVDYYLFFFFQAEDGIRDLTVTGVQTCALPISQRDSAADRAALSHPFRARSARRFRRQTGSLGLRGAARPPKGRESFSRFRKVLAENVERWPRRRLGVRARQRRSEIQRGQPGRRKNHDRG